MTPTVTVSFRIPASVHAALKREAEQTAPKLSLNYVVVRALQTYVNSPMPGLDAAEDRKCDHCGAMTWTRMHQMTCERVYADAPKWTIPPPIRTAKKPVARRGRGRK